MGKGGGIESWECEVCQRRCDCNDGLQRGENFEEFLEEVMRDIRRGANWIENHRVWIEDDVCSNNGKKAEPDMPVCCLHRSHLPCRSRSASACRIESFHSQYPLTLTLAFALPQEHRSSVLWLYELRGLR